MTPADKDKLKTAFTKAVNASPYAEEKIDGMVMNDGSPATRRKFVEATLQMEEFYTQVDEMLSHGKVTLDQFIGKFEEGMKKPFYGNEP